VRKINCWH